MAIDPQPSPSSTSAQTSAVSLAIWNPNAAANWSLLFSPAFGAYLHMRNWHALQEPAKAASAKGWFIASLIMLGVYVVLGFLFPNSKTVNAATRGLALAYLLVWYFAAARGQVKYVNARFGTSYERRKWGKPLAVGALAIIGLFIVGIFFALLQLIWSRLT
jgi:hypothetical protein